MYRCEFTSPLVNIIPSQPIPSTWETTENGIDIKLDGERLINHVVLAEDLTDGESIRAFNLYIKSRMEFRCLFIRKYCITVYAAKLTGFSQSITLTTCIPS
jgi:hypothetical protein